jgi:hypothetical protein
MSRTLEQITNDALGLSKPEQMRLVRVLLEEIEPPDPDAESAWEQEIQQRIEQIDTGIAEGRPFADVLRDIDLKLGR